MFFFLIVVWYEDKHYPLCRSAGPQIIPSQTYDYASLNAFVSDSDHLAVGNDMVGGNTDRQAGVFNEVSDGTNDVGSDSQESPGTGGDSKGSENNVAGNDNEQSTNTESTP